MIERAQRGIASGIVIAGPRVAGPSRASPAASADDGSRAFVGGRHLDWPLVHAAFRTITAAVVAAAALTHPGSRAPFAIAGPVLRSPEDPGATAVLAAAARQPQVPVVHVAVRPRHRQAAAIDLAGRVTLWSSDDGRVLWDAQATSVRRDDIAVAFSPDGRYVALGGETSEVLVLDAEHGTPVVRLTAHRPDLMGAYHVGSLRWLRDGSLRAIAGPEEDLRLWDVSEPTQPQLAAPRSIDAVPGGDAFAGSETIPFSFTSSANRRAVSAYERTLSLATSDGVFTYDVDALLTELTQARALGPSELLRWVEERTGLRLADGQEAALRRANFLAPQMAPSDP